jgi:hypothetical protein
MKKAFENITKAIHNAAWKATPDGNKQNSMEECPVIVKQKIAGKRKARKR